MRPYHPENRAQIVKDDPSRQFNHVVAMKRAAFQRAGNRNMTFPAIVECLFFTRSKLSYAVQLAYSRTGTGERPATRVGA